MSDPVKDKERMGDVLNAFAKVVGEAVGRTLSVRLTARKAGESGNVWLEKMGSTVHCSRARAKAVAEVGSEEGWVGARC